MNDKFVDSINKYSAYAKMLLDKYPTFPWYKRLCNQYFGTRFHPFTDEQKAHFEVLEKALIDSLDKDE